MRYRALGRTGFEVSEIGHGLWGMGGWTGSDDRQSLDALRASVAIGINFFDSAWDYGKGRSDRLLGQLLREFPDKKLVAASKVPPKNMKWPATANDALRDVFPREHVMKYAEIIRNDLGVDRIDLLQFHVWDDSWTDDNEWRDTVAELRQSGRFRAFGVSLNGGEPANGVKVVATGLIDTVQAVFNLFEQEPEDELLPACRAANVGVIARVPLDEGSLGGKFTRETTFPTDDWRHYYFNPENLKETIRRVEALRRDIPDAMSLPEAALRFVLSYPEVSTTIVGMRKAEYVASNAAAVAAGPLPQELLSRLRRHRWNRSKGGS